MSKFKLLTVSIGSASMAAIFAMSHNMPFFFGSLVLSFAFLVTWKTDMIETKR